MHRGPFLVFLRGVTCRDRLVFPMSSRLPYDSFVQYRQRDVDNLMLKSLWRLYVIDLGLNLVPGARRRVARLRASQSQSEVARTRSAAGPSAGRYFSSKDAACIECVESRRSARIVDLDGGVRVCAVTRRAQAAHGKIRLVRPPPLSVEHDFSFLSFYADDTAHAVFIWLAFGICTPCLLFSRGRFAATKCISRRSIQSTVLLDVHVELDCLWLAGWDSAVRLCAMTQCSTHFSSTFVLFFFLFLVCLYKCSAERRCAKGECRASGASADARAQTRAQVRR